MLGQVFSCRVSAGACLLLALASLFVVFPSVSDAKTHRHRLSPINAGNVVPRILCGDAGHACCAPVPAHNGVVVDKPYCHAGLGCDIVAGTCASACGGAGQVCCDGPDTYAPQGGVSPSSPIYCGAQGCVARKPMCAAGACDPASHRCQSCGTAAGATCCPPDAQQATASCKAPGLVCQSANIAARGGTCVVCGGSGQPPCAGDSCGPGLISEQNKCQECGKIGEPPCTNGCQQGELSIPPTECVTNARCDIYARNAVQTAAQNFQSACGFSGDRWQTDYSGHFNWCLTASADQTKSEQQARIDGLGLCQACKNSPLVEKALAVCNVCGFGGRSASEIVSSMFSFCMGHSDSEESCDACPESGAGSSSPGGPPSNHCCTLPCAPGGGSVPNQPGFPGGAGGGCTPTYTCGPQCP
jgi:hypothetical protein